MPEGDSSSVTEALPPEKLLATEQLSLIRGGIACMHDIDTVRQYVAYENQHHNRAGVLQLLAERADTLRADDEDTTTDDPDRRDLIW